MFLEPWVADDTTFEALYRKASAAGLRAAALASPRPITVHDPDALARALKNEQVEAVWVIGEGLVGGATVYVTPTTHSFARWLLKTNRGSKDPVRRAIAIKAMYEGQSVERSIAFALAFMLTLTEAQLGMRVEIGARLS